MFHDCLGFSKIFEIIVTLFIFYEYIEHVKTNL